MSGCPPCWTKELPALLLAISVTRVFLVLSLFWAPLLLTVVGVERCPATEAWAAMGTGAETGCWLAETVVVLSTEL